MTQAHAGDMWVFSEEDAARVVSAPTAATDEVGPGSVVAFALPDAPLPPGVLESVRAALEVSTSSTEQARKILETLTRDLGGVGEGVLLQARLTAQRLRDIDAEFGMLTSEQVARAAGSRARNTSATPTRWVREGKIFTVDVADQRLYPAFQFATDTGKPLGVIAEAMAAYGDASGTSLALWFAAGNGHLDDARPVDLLTTDPAAVVDAAARARTPSV